MATYQYRCPACGLFDIERAMGAATAVDDCPCCGGAARRSYTVPHVGRTPAPLARALATAEKSRDEPEVVRRSTAGGASRAPQAPTANGHALPRW